MIVSQLKQLGVSELRSVSIDSAALDAEVLLALVLNCRREQLLSGSENEVPPELEKRFHDLLSRRKKFEPVAYIVGSREFYGRDFFVTPAVLIPRPETEFVIEEALAVAAKLDEREELLLVDVGTGSGAIVITLVEEIRRQFRFADLKAMALDVSEDALDIARGNAAKFGLTDSIEFLQSNLFQNIPATSLHRGTFAIITANLPYIPNAELLPADVNDFEPQTALRGGESGLEVIQRCIEQIRRLEPCGRGSAIYEIGAGQSEPLGKEYPGAVFFRKDLQGIERVGRMNYCQRC